MDTLPPEHFRQGVRGGAVEKVDNPGRRGKTHLSKVRIKNAIYKEKDGVFEATSYQIFLIYCYK